MGEKRKHYLCAKLPPVKYEFYANCVTLGVVPNQDQNGIIIRNWSNRLERQSTRLKSCWVRNWRSWNQTALDIVAKRDAFFDQKSGSQFRNFCVRKTWRTLFDPLIKVSSLWTRMSSSPSKKTFSSETLKKFLRSISRKKIPQGIWKENAKDLW